MNSGLGRACPLTRNLPSTDPATTQIIGSCPEFDAKDTEAAAAAAGEAFKTYRQLKPRDRSQLLLKWYELLVENADDIARIITSENGKPLAEAKGEVIFGASFLGWFAEEAPRMDGDSMRATNPDCRIVTVKEPVGACGLITPWNFPASMITRKAAPALAAGCSVIIKAPAETPLTALALAELASRAGFPPGVLNVVTASLNTQAVGEVLTTHPIIKKFSFTGSTPVGKLLLRQCSSTMKKTSFELGGNAPFIVFEDADLEEAVKGLGISKFRNSGQKCVCANRIYVQDSIHDKFVAMVKESLKEFKVGDGLVQGTTHGPLIHTRAADKVASLVEDAVSHGATVVAGGRRLSELGPNFYDITLLTHMTPGMRCSTEEIFGPIAAFYRFKDEQNVISLANDSEFGLAGYFYSRDVGRCWRVAEALEVGMVGVNCGTLFITATPFLGAPSH